MGDGVPSGEGGVNPGPASSRARGMWTRLAGSAVAWSWVFNALRLASGLVLLPLLGVTLSKTDFGMYYVFLTLATIVPMMDFGFALSVERALSYALGGAKSIEAHGVSDRGESGSPNWVLVAGIIGSARRLYRSLALGALALLGVVGSLVIGMQVQMTSSPGWTWLAWGVHLVGLSLEIYTAYWVAVLRGLNRVVEGARWLSLAHGIKLVLAAILLMAGLGLMALPVAGLVTGIILRAGAGRAVRAYLRTAGAAADAAPGLGSGSGLQLARVLWPNSWRLGAQLAAQFASATAFLALCSHQFGVAAWGEYGLSVQLMNISLGIAAVWTSVKWPAVAQLRLRGDRDGMRRLLWPRYWLQVLTFLVLAAMAIGVVPWVLRVTGSDKAMLPRGVLLLLAVDALGQLNFAWWTTLISTENRIPAFKAFIATQLLAILGAALLVLGLGWGLSALVVTPLVLGWAFNYWWWAREGSRMLGTTFPRFLMGPFAHASSTT